MRLALLVEAGADSTYERVPVSSTMFSLRITAAELTRIVLAAKARGDCASELMRSGTPAAKLEDQEDTENGSALGVS